jgi:hypothetical protein
LEPLLASVTAAVFKQAAVRLSSKALDEQRVLRWLGRDAQRLAFKAALAGALADLRAKHPVDADEFFDETFLASVKATALLARCIPPAEPPSAEELAEACAAQHSGAASMERRVAALTPPSELFLARLRARLRANEAFRPLFESESADVAVERLGEIAERLDALPRILERVEHPRARLKRQIISSAARVRTWTEGFVGREFIFSELDTRLMESGFRSGYTLVRGEPGIGKTAIAAELIRSRNYVHHFNVATDGVRETRLFLPNVCAQLIERYGLPYETLPRHAEVGSAQLTALLDEAAGVARDDGDLPVVIVVDALDEAETPDPDTGENRLALPYELPEGVYVIATIRAGVDAVLDIADQAEDVVLDRDDPRNAADVRAFVTGFLEREDAVMRERLGEWEVNAEGFVETLAARSEGNFMYLVHVLSDIAAGRIAPGDLEGRLERLPGGLERYYKRHWRAMHDSGTFRRRQKPVIAMLASARDAVPAAKVAEWINAGGFEPIAVDEVEDIFDDWRPFLSIEPGDPPRYRLYHASFLDFLEREVGLQPYREAVGAAMAKKIEW